MSFRAVLTISKRKLLIDGVCTKAMSISKTYFHVNHVAQAHEQSKHIGNPWRFPHLVGKENVPTWKVNWLYLMKRKAEVEGDTEPGPRCNQLNWDYDTELKAFAHRLHIEVYADIIKKVFMEPLEDEPDAQNNQELHETGQQFATDFIDLYVKEAFPKIGHNCALSVKDYLISEDLTSNIANNLGYRDLIQTPLATVDDRTVSRCFLASVAAILHGPGGRVEAARFLNDFVITDLLDKDLVHDIWRPKDPMKELVNEYTTRGLTPPEVRLAKQAGLNSILPVFYVALFCDKKFVVESAQTGKTVDPKDVCSPCSGDGVSNEKKILEVQITPGMEHGEKIVFGQEGDQSPEYKIPGDVVIVLQEKKHEKYTRQKQDLLISRTITLKEALCGLSFPLTHLDGRVLLVKLAEGDCVKPGSVKCISNEGMPHKRNPFSKGNMLIKFEVEMPEGLSAKVLDTLRKVLPGPTEEAVDMDNAEECYLKDVNVGAYNTERAHQEDSDDDEGGGGQRAQCVHQ